MKTLLDECIEALEPNVKVFDLELSHEIVNRMPDNYPFTIYGRIDWGKVEKKRAISNSLLPSILDISDEVYVIWDGSTNNVLKTKIENVMKNIDDVLAVSFDTWLMQLDGNYIIEYHHNGNINLAFK
ncbi:hypothetical protein WAF17_00305 [Bernardetia sp. ABR2-2B]|uniref:CDI toxin immunity protein n=1 Tax=Bernardetia sp. ABR2-2B TaxID=3127472 RepID=UPI0030D3DD76